MTLRRILMALGMGLLMGGCTPPPAGLRPAAPPVVAPPIPRESPAKLVELIELQAQLASAAQEQNLPRLLTATGLLERLELVEPENIRRRDEVLAKARTQAATLRDALHRFLFAELEPLPPDQRKTLLEAADRGDADALERAGQALAQADFAASRKYLRPVAAAPAAKDAATGLTIRQAAKPPSRWQTRLNTGFNDKMRQLVLAATQPSD